MDGRDGAPRQYRGMVDCFRQVACKEGLAGLYKARECAAAASRRSGTLAVENNACLLPPAVQAVSASCPRELMWLKLRGSAIP